VVAGVSFGVDVVVLVTDVSLVANEATSTSLSESGEEPLMMDATTLCDRESLSPPLVVDEDLPLVEVVRVATSVGAAPLASIRASLLPAVDEKET